MSILKQETCTYNFIREKCPKLCGFCRDGVVTSNGAAEDTPVTEFQAGTSSSNPSHSIDVATLVGIFSLFISMLML